MRWADGPALLLAILPAVAAAQETQTYAGFGAERDRTVSVRPSERYEAGPLHQLLFGRRYRDLWSTPIEVPVLDLDSFAGGLTPDERGGGQQTLSLHFTSGDGREFTFRTLDKDPTKAVPEPYRGTVVHRLVQDATSAMQPGGAQLAPALLAAAGVLHAAPRLFVMPADPRLGPHRDDFAGAVGTLEERPGDGFAGAQDVEDSDDFFEHLRESPAHRVDAAAFLTARLVDHLLGDWDRHRDQWRWAAFPADGFTRWRPIPRDRDQALARYDGVVTTLARERNPKLTTFGPEFPQDLVGFTWNGRDLDRPLLASLDAATFDSVAAALQAALTDSVIADAVDRLPSAWRASWGEWTASALRQRRDDLRTHARRYYRYLASDVDVWATDADDRVEARWTDGTLRLRLWSDADTAPWFDRRFLPGETDEVRLHLREGADLVRLTGERRGPRLLVVREPRDSVVRERGAGVVSLLQHRPEPARDGDSEEEEPEMPRDWGRERSAGPRAGYDPDLGLLLGAGAGWTEYGFRYDPYRARVRASGLYATGADGLLAEVSADLRRRDPRTRIGLSIRASEIDVVRFHGLGNETPDLAGAAEVAFWRLTIAAAYERDLSPSLRLRTGPLLRYGTTDRGETIVARSRVRGVGGFGRVGAAGDLELRRSGVHGSLGASVYPPLWSAAATFGEVHGELRATVPLAGSSLGEPSLASRLGGRRVWGPFPYDEAAFLGGVGTLRGYDYQRFAGDASVYGSLELRVPVARVLSRTVPTRVGLIALADAGRVWAEGTGSARLHAATGGGVWLELFEPCYAFSVVHARGDEGGRWYLQLGLPY